MAYITKRRYKKKGDGNPKTYYYVAESIKINGVSHQKIIRSLGTIEEINEFYESKSSIECNELISGDYIEFGAVSAVYDIVKRLDIEAIIDKYAAKRDQGLTIGNYIALAAINRAVNPVSKQSFYGWFKETILVSHYVIDEKTLSSQNFWHHMVALDQLTIEQIEEEITNKVVSTYNISKSSILLDNTNFLTYISSTNKALIPRRGHSKEKRSDLKIIGLSLMVSSDYNIPLYHQIYPGNRNDSTQFKETIGQIKNRYAKLNSQNDNITLIFDKGNNSDENIKLIEDIDPDKFKFVGSLKFSQCPELLEVDNDKFCNLEGINFNQTTAYRAEKYIYGNNYTVLVTNNPELKNAQLVGINANIETSKAKFNELQSRLQKRAEKIIVGGIKPTLKSVTKNINDILSKEYMAEVFNYNINVIDKDKITITYSFNDNNFQKLSEKRLGKTILFTNRHEWTNEQIVSAYRSQYHIEDVFKQLKNTKYLSFRPVRHFTDKTIIVHGFYCVLAYLLVSILKLQFDKLGYDISIANIMDDLSKSKQIIVACKKTKTSNVKFEALYSHKSDIAAKYIEKYGLKKYGLNLTTDLKDYHFIN